MATLTISQVCGVVVGQEEKPTPSRCDWHVSIGPLGPYILAHGGLTIATPSGLAGKQSWGKVRERGRSKEEVGQIILPMLQNKPQESWNEVNSMPTYRPDFGVIWTNMAKLTNRTCWQTTELSPCPPSCSSVFSPDRPRVFVVAIFISFPFTVTEQNPVNCMKMSHCCFTVLIHTHRLSQLSCGQFDQHFLVINFAGGQHLFTMNITLNHHPSKW